MSENTDPKNEEEVVEVSPELTEEEQKKLEAEIMEKIQDAQKMMRAATARMFHQPTRPHSDKKRGVGITRKNQEETKAAKKKAKKQRKINHKMSNKKFRPTGSRSRR